ncbi:hypothetical protein CHU98_g2929 [Xylaria longipes]|nr:hypothetical protein CHU98_g2929 [Xylaria longipes]
MLDYNTVAGDWHSDGKKGILQLQQSSNGMRLGRACCLFVTASSKDVTGERANAWSNVTIVKSRDDEDGGPKASGRGRTTAVGDALVDDDNDGHLSESPGSHDVLDCALRATGSFL